MTIKAVVHEEDGGYWAEVPGMPGCVTQGDTMDEIVSNLQEALEGWMGAHQDLKIEARGEIQEGQVVDLTYAFSRADLGEYLKPLALLNPA